MLVTKCISFFNANNERGKGTNNIRLFHKLLYNYIKCILKMPTNSNKNIFLSGPIEHSDSETDSQINEDISKLCFCRVDAKKFSMFLSADQMSHSKKVCSIVHKKLVILCLETEQDVKLQCFINGIVY